MARNRNCSTRALYFVKKDPHPLKRALYSIKKDPYSVKRALYSITRSLHSPSAQQRPVLYVTSTLYAMSDEPCTLLHETRTLSKESRTLSKKTHTLSKEPCTLSKKTHILSKEPCTLSLEPGAVHSSAHMLYISVSCCIHLIYVYTVLYTPVRRGSAQMMWFRARAAAQASSDSVQGYFDRVWEIFDRVQCSFHKAQGTYQCGERALGCCN